MLNEMLYILDKCPVCGRYHRGPLPGWWCPYCGPSLDSIKLKELTNRVDIIEAFVKWYDMKEMEG